MTDKQIISGILVQSLLNTLYDMGTGKKPRTKLMNTFRKVHHRLDRDKPQTMIRCGQLANKALHQSMDDFPDGIEMTISKILFIWSNREPETFKPYKLNQKHVQSLSRAAGVDNCAFTSAKVVTSITNQITNVIKEYNETNKRTIPDSETPS